jgi:ribonuclease Z
VTFLGTGDAFSIGRRGNLALLIEAGNFHVLIESGPTIVQQLHHVNWRAIEVERLFVSHAHGDHALGFPVLLLHRLWEPPPLHVYANASTVTALNTLCDVVYPEFDSAFLNVRWHELPDEPAQTDVTPGITLRTVGVPHPPGVPTLAARWDFDAGPSLTFVTDTYPNDAALELARGSDLLIHEANFSTTLQHDVDFSRYFHSTAQQVGDLARRAGCPRLALVHLGPEGSEQPDVLAEEARAGSDLHVIVPEDGETLRLRKEEVS